MKKVIWKASYFSNARECKKINNISIVKKLKGNERSERALKSIVAPYTASINAIAY